MSNYIILIDPPNDIFTCRICLDDDILDNLIYPCKCSGYMKYVHPNCLNIWHNTTCNKSYICNICNFSYNIINKPIILNKLSTLFKSSPFIFSFIFLFISLISSSIFYGIDNNNSILSLFNITYDNIYTNFRIYYILVFYFFLIILKFFIFKDILNFSKKQFKIYTTCDLFKIIYFINLFTIIIIYSIIFNNLNLAIDILLSTLLLFNSNMFHIKAIEFINSSLKPEVSNYN